MTAPRILYALFVAYVVATAVHLGFVMLHEPFFFDAWNVALDTDARPATAGRFFDYWWFEYTRSNPRLGQALTYLSYKLEYFAVIATPVAYLAISLAVTILGLGRWPTRGRDLAMWAIAIGFGWFAFPELGRNMFTRAYGANYIFGAAIQLWFLVPLRLVKTNATSSRVYFAYAIAGVVAGLCNEHTGPALIALLSWLAWRSRRRGEVAGLPWAGALGLLAGFAALFFAPGQGERYDGLADRASFFMRVMKRGVIGNLDIVRDYLIYASPLLALVVIVVIANRSTETDRKTKDHALSLVAVALVVGALMTLTLFASPKLGSRFYIVANALLLGATIAIFDALGSKRLVVMMTLLAIGGSAYAVNRTVPLYLRVGEQGAERMAMLESSRPGEVLLVEAFEQVEESWWFIGDDFRTPQKRRMVAQYFALSRVMLRGWDPKSPLGTTGIRVVARALDKAGVARETELDVDEATGPSVELVIERARKAFEQAKQQGSDSFEVIVEFVGPKPSLPRPKIVVARVRPGGRELEAHVGSISRPGVSRLREVRVPEALRSPAYEVFAVQVGSQSLRLGTGSEPLSYTPWRTGIYWALACTASECWLFAVSRNHG